MLSICERSTGIAEIYLASGLGQSESFPPSAPFFGSELLDEFEGAGDAPFFGSELFEEDVGVGTADFVATLAWIHTNFLFCLSHMNVLPAILVVAPGFVHEPPDFAAANAPEVSPRSKMTEIEMIAISDFSRFKWLNIIEG